MAHPAESLLYKNEDLRSNPSHTKQNKNLNLSVSGVKINW
jgi:hypothetical protein